LRSILSTRSGGGATNSCALDSTGARAMSPLRRYTGEFDERGEAKLVAPEPGRYELKWMLVRKRTGGSESRDWPDEASVIEVLDSSELQRFAVRCPIDPATAWNEK